MNTYLFGSHDGALPTNLVGHGEPDNRIRAMTRLEGPDHSVIYALDHDSSDRSALDPLHDVIGEAGSIIAETITLCETVPCLELINKVDKYVPISMPPYDVLAFILCKVEGILEFHPDITGDVGAGTDGQGNVIVEFGGGTEEEVQRNVDLLLGTDNVSEARVYWSRDEHLARL